MSKASELSISISRKAVENSNGFAMDIGGSAVKLAYRHKDDWRELQKQGPDIQTAKLRLKVFAKEDAEKAVEFLSKYCYISRECDEGCAVVNIAGMGASHITTMLKKKLNMAPQILNEMKCFSKAFVELAGTLQQDDFEYTSTEERRQELQAIMLTWCDFLAAINEDTDERRAVMHLRARSWYMGSRMTAERVNMPIAQSLPKMYPALIYLVSSASIFFMVKSDGHYDAFGVSMTGGLNFLGLGNTICRSKKSYDELIDMAEQGDYTAVDETAGVYKSSGEETAYSRIANKGMAEDETLYAFRKVINDPSASHKEEDLILSLLKSIVRYQAQIAVTTAESRGMAHVYLTGSFYNRQLVRTIFEEEFCRQLVVASNWNDEKGMDIEMHFVKTGGYLGSIGAFLNSAKSQPEN